MSQVNNLNSCTILNENFFSPSIAFPNDGSAYPKKNNKFAENYKDLIINGIKKNNIEIIYIIHPIKKESLYDYLDETCFEEKIIFAKLNSYKLLKCSDLNKQFLYYLFSCGTNQLWFVYYLNIMFKSTKI